MENTEPLSADQGLVVRNSVYLLVAKAISTGLGLFLVIYLARTLGADDYGRYVFAGGFLSFFVIMGDLGLNNLATRRLAREKEHAGRFLGTVAPLRFLLALGALLLSFIFLRLIGYPDEMREVAHIMAVGALMIGTYGYMYIHVFEGYERMQYITLLDSFKRALFLVMSVVVLSSGHGVIALMYAYVAHELLHLIAAWWISRKKLGLRIQFRFAPGEWRSLITTALPFALILTFMTILTSTDIAMLGRMRTQEEMGWYGASIRLVSTVVLIPMMVASAMFPTASRLFHQSVERVRNLFIGVIRPMIMLGIPVAVGTTIVADDLILLLYESAYQPSAGALRILIWSAALNFVNLPVIFILTSIDRQKYGTIAMGISAVINVMCNFILISHYGIIGASIATVVSQLVLLVCCLPPLTRALPNLEMWRHLIHPAIGGLVMGAAIWPLHTLPVIPRIIAGIIVYGIVMMVGGGLKRADWRDFIRMMNPL